MGFGGITLRELSPRHQETPERQLSRRQGGNVLFLRKRELQNQRTHTASPFPPSAWAPHESGFAPGVTRELADAEDTRDQFLKTTLVSRALPVTGLVSCSDSQRSIAALHRKEKSGHSQYRT